MSATFFFSHAGPDIEGNGFLIDFFEALQERVQTKRSPSSSRTDGTGFMDVRSKTHAVDYTKTIGPALAYAGAFVAVLSRNFFNARHDCLRELEAFLCRDVDAPVIPLFWQPPNEYLPYLPRTVFDRANRFLNDAQEYRKLGLRRIIATGNEGAKDAVLDAIAQRIWDVERLAPEGDPELSARIMRKEERGTVFAIEHIQAIHDSVQYASLASDLLRNLGDTQFSFSPNLIQTAASAAAEKNIDEKDLVAAVYELARLPEPEVKLARFLNLLKSHAKGEEADLLGVGMTALKVNPEQLRGFQNRPVYRVLIAVEERLGGVGADGAIKDYTLFTFLNGEPFPTCEEGCPLNAEDFRVEFERALNEGMRSAKGVGATSLQVEAMLPLELLVRYDIDEYEIPLGKSGKRVIGKICPLIVRSWDRATGQTDYLTSRSFLVDKWHRIPPLQDLHPYTHLTDWSDVDSLYDISDDMIAVTSEVSLPQDLEVRYQLVDAIIGTGIPLAFWPRRTKFDHCTAFFRRPALELPSQALALRKQVPDNTFTLLYDRVDDVPDALIPSKVSPT